MNGYLNIKLPRHDAHRRADNNSQSDAHNLCTLSTLRQYRETLSHYAILIASLFLIGDERLKD